jgi:hypothetical protein
MAGQPEEPSTVSSSSLSERVRRNTKISPIEATATEITKIANEASPRRSAIDWHSSVNIFHCW